MAESAQLVLKKALGMLVAQKAQTEREIKAVQVALDAIGVNSSRLASRRRRAPMTPAERKSVSKRMKTYWAKKRSEKGS